MKLLKMIYEVANTVMGDQLAMNPVAKKVDVTATVENNNEAKKITIVDVAERPAPGVETGFLSGAELAQLTANWEAWDAYLVHTIKPIGLYQLSADDRRRLLDTLLTIRYQFFTAPTTATIERDIIRQQFVAARENLTPVFRRHLGGRPSGNLFGYLAFFTAF